MAAPQHNQNPDYYAETANMGPVPEHIQQAQQQQQYPPPPPPQPPRPEQQHPYYPPPPTGGTPYQGQPSGESSSGKPPAYTADAGGSSSTSGKSTFTERLHQWSIKAGVPINKVTNRLGSEAFWPSSLEIECDKAARILKSFCKDGFYTTEIPDGASKPTSPGPKGKPKVLVKIPQKAIQSAAGLAIFTTFRTALHISGAGGSGVIVSRLPDGSWSPPSGFLVHTLGAGFMIGLDIYDCVCVLRTPEAVAAFTRPRLSLGGEIGIAAGPVGAGTSVEGAISKSTKPVWSYMKSRGFYAGVQADGTIVIARPDANAAFYGQKGIKVENILAGRVPTSGPQWPVGATHLMEVLKSAEGRTDINENVMKEVSSGPTPGDLGLGEHGREKEVAGSVHDQKTGYY